MASFQAWKKKVLGPPPQHLNVDKAFGDQCVDVAMDFVQYIWNKPWPQILGYGNAKDLFYTSSASYFTKVNNNPHDLKQLPRQGDLIVYGATKTNPYGHIAIVDYANPIGVGEIEQNGFNPTGAAYETFRKWGTSPCIGWLRPKASLVAVIAQKVAPKPPVQPLYYVVHAGDNLTAIAKKFGTNVANLVKLNKLANPNVIKIGQRLRIK